MAERVYRDGLWGNHGFVQIDIFTSFFPYIVLFLSNVSFYFFQIVNQKLENIN